jgi:hypothetical protein
MSDAAKDKPFSFGYNLSRSSNYGREFNILFDRSSGINVLTRILMATMRAWIPPDDMGSLFELG